MKIRHRVHALFVVMLLMSASLADDGFDVLFEQNPIDIGNPASAPILISSTQSDDPKEPRAKAWDNFSLAADSIMSKLTWQGAYNNPFNPNDTFRGDVDFVVEIFPNLSGDTPDLDNALLSVTLDAGTAGRNDGTDVTSMVVPDAQQKDGGVVMRYDADLTFVLSAGDYWLSIVADQTFPSPHPDDQPTNPNAYLDPTWGWISAVDGDNLLYQFDEQFDAMEPGFRFTSHNCPIEGCDGTFSMLGEVIPEPTSASLLVMAVLGLGVRRRRSRAA